MIKKFCFFENMSNRAAIGLLLLRVVAGIAFILHGYSKIQTPMSWMGPEAQVPGFMQMLAAVAEFGGGICWVLGLAFPIASFLIGCTMVVAVYTHAVVYGQPFVGMQGSYESAAMYLMLCIFFFLNGPGKYSLDAKICHK